MRFSELMMGVHDPTDDATAIGSAQSCGSCGTRGRVLQQMRKQERQTDMQKQRQLVDRDLLAGGAQMARRT